MPESHARARRGYRRVLPDHDVALHKVLLGLPAAGHGQSNEMPSLCCVITNLGLNYYCSDARAEEEARRGHSRVHPDHDDGPCKVLLSASNGSLQQVAPPSPPARSPANILWPPAAANANANAMYDGGHFS